MNRPERESAGRQRILEAGEVLFVERGYAAVSIREIAQVCGITSAALYYHFSSKAELFIRVLEQHVTRIEARMRAVGEKEMDLKASVRAMIWEYCRANQEFRSLFMGLAREAQNKRIPISLQKMERLIRKMLAPLSEALKEGVENGLIRTVPGMISPAAMLIGMLHGVSQHLNTCSGGQLLERDIDWILDVFWEGILNPEVDRRSRYENNQAAESA